MGRFNFTKRVLDNLPLPERNKLVDHYDDQIRNLFVRLSWTASMAFYVRRKIGGKSERIFIGRYPDLSIEQARKEAALILAEVAKGNNPQEVKRTARREQTLGEVFDNYLNGYAVFRCIRVKDMIQDFQRYLSDWRDRKYSAITRHEVQTRANQIMQNNGRGAANHIIILMRAAINWNLKAGLVQGENTWSGIQQWKIPPRERFLRPEEFSAFFDALDRCENEALRDYVKLSLFTGARRSNVLAMRWDQIDFNLGLWRIPMTKNKEPLTLPLTRQAMSLLLVRRKKSQSEWVFEGNVPGRHLVEPKRAWYKLLETAKINDLRIHDLRRTLGSYMAINNNSLTIIAKALGHKSTAATQIYSRLTNDPVRLAMEQAQEKMISLSLVTISDTKSTNPQLDERTAG